jgi:hypothetical protein
LRINGMRTMCAITINRNVVMLTVVIITGIAIANPWRIVAGMVNGIFLISMV